MTVAPMLRAALQLAERGLAVFPCQPKGKQPVTLHGCKDATRDPDMIEAWWHRMPTCNVGVATGAFSGVIVVDVDDIDAEAELRNLELRTAHCRPRSKA